MINNEYYHLTWAGDKDWNAGIADMKTRSEADSAASAANPSLEWRVTIK
jgi:hypothetical protein